jgi:hypothetical protein
MVDEGEMFDWTWLDITSGLDKFLESAKNLVKTLSFLLLLKSVNSQVNSRCFNGVSKSGNSCYCSKTKSCRLVQCN